MLPASDALTRILGSMDMVRIRASISAGGLRKGQEVTVAETPMIAGGIKNGVYILLERFPVEPLATADGIGCPEPGCILHLGHDGIDPDVHTDVHGDHFPTGGVLVTEPDDPTHPAPDDDPEPTIEDVELPPSADVHDPAEPSRRRRG